MLLAFIITTVFLVCICMRVRVVELYKEARLSYL